MFFLLKDSPGSGYATCPGVNCLVVFSFIVVFGSTLKLAAMGNVVCIERDWVVILAGNDSRHLSSKDLITRNQ